MKKYNIYSQIALVLSFLIIPMSFFSIVDEMKAFRITCLFVAICIFVLGIISLKQIKKTKTKGRGYVIISLIISTVVFLFLILMSIISYDQPEQPLNILEDKKEQDSSKIKVLVEREALALKLSVINDIWSPIGITEKNIDNVDIIINEDSSRAILITFNEEGRNILEKITTENIGKQLGVFINEVPVSIPVIKEKVTGGQISIFSPELTDEELINFKERLLGFSYKNL